MNLSRSTEKLYVFIDESGNSGNVDHSKKGELNYVAQPAFSLAGILVPESRIEEAGAAIDTIIQRYSSGHNEAKSNTLGHKNPQLVIDLIKVLNANDCTIIVEAMDKNYYIIIHLMGAFITPYEAMKGIYEVTKEPIKPYLVNNADLLLQNLPKEFYSKAVKLFNRKDERVFHDFMSLLLEEFSKDIYPTFFFDLMTAFYLFINDRLIAGDKFEEVIDVFLQTPRKVKRQQFPLLPHVEAFYTLVARAEAYRKNKGYSPLNIVHDTQDQFQDLLLQHLDRLKVNSKVKREVIKVTTSHDPDQFEYIINPSTSMRFEDSRGEPLIRAADFIAGAVNRIWNTYCSGKQLQPSLIKILHLLSDQNSGRGVHWIGETNRLKKFYKKFGGDRFVVLS